MKYRPEIDGLRCVAVIPVILFHAGFSTFSGGYVGVDVFFVISGYLITTIILSEMEEGTFSIVNFYERRARRILPALFLIMLASLPFAWFRLMPKDLIDYSQSLAAVSSFSSNILFWQQDSYMNPVNELKPLLHTWSLAVEEQYYVLFPIFLILMWHHQKRWVLGSFVLLGGVSLAIAHWGAYYKPKPTFYLLPTRGWELAIGAGIAFYFLYRKQTARKLISNKFFDEVLGFIGLLMICYSIFAFNKKTPFPSLYALIPTIGTGLIILFSSSKTLAGRLLGTRPLVAIGLISYSAYLWHQPLFAFFRYNRFPEPDSLVLLGLAFFAFSISYLSWRFVEKPFRNKRNFGRKTIFIFALTGSLMFIVIGCCGYFSDGFKQGSMYTRLLIRNYQPENHVLKQQSWNILRKLSGDNRYGLHKNEYDRQLWFKNVDNRQRLLLVGNSHSKDLYNVLINSNHAKANFQIARYGCQIRNLINNHSKMFDSPNYTASDVVMLISRYNKEDLDKLHQVVEKILKDSKTVVIVKKIFGFDYYNGINLADHIFRNNIGVGKSSASMLVKSSDKAYYDQYVTSDKLLRKKRSDASIESIANNYCGILILERMDYVCDKNAERCFSINDKFEKYFFDYGHHTLEGAQFFGKRVDQVGWLDKLVKRQFENQLGTL